MSLSCWYRWVLYVASGCKRIIVDPDYLKSLHQPNVTELGQHQGGCGRRDQAQNRRSDSFGHHHLWNRSFHYKFSCAFCIANWTAHHRKSPKWLMPWAARTKQQVITSKNKVDLLHIWDVQYWAFQTCIYFLVGVQSSGCKFEKPSIEHPKYAIGLPCSLK